MLSTVNILLIAGALAQAVSANDQAHVVNKCTYDVYLWSVGSQIDGPHTVGKNGGVYTENYARDPNGGQALKITKEPNGLYEGKPQTIFAYNVKEGKVWYDLTQLFGDAFRGSKLVEASANTGCPSIVFENGISPGGSNVRVCPGDADTTLTLCA